MKCVVIDYGSGNLRSVAKSLERVAPEGFEVTVTSDPKSLALATHIVLPGVGAFADCVRGVTEISGMVDALEREVRERKKPFLGICVGMQMLFERGLEHGTHKGLGWLEGEVVKIDGQMMDGQIIENEDNNLKQTISSHPPIRPSAHLKIPHIGWNDLTIRSLNHPLIQNISTGDHAYFVHSYHAVCKNASDVIATTDYGAALTAIVAKDNIMGAQFHPEKSQAAGLQLLRNFLHLQ